MILPGVDSDFLLESCIEDLCLGGQSVCDIIMDLVAYCTDFNVMIQDWGQFNYCSECQYFLVSEIKTVLLLWPCR